MDDFEIKRTLMLIILLFSGCATMQPINITKVCSELKIHFCNREFMYESFPGMLGCTDGQREIWVLKEYFEDPPTKLECEILGEEVYHQWTLKGNWHTNNANWHINNAKDFNNHK